MAQDTKEQEQQQRPKTREEWFTEHSVPLPEETYEAIAHLLEVAFHSIDYFNEDFVLGAGDLAGRFEEISQ